MNRDEILKMEEGQDLDFLIFDKFFAGDYEEKIRRVLARGTFRPSKFIGHAWLVVEKLRRMNCFVNVYAETGCEIGPAIRYGLLMARGTDDCLNICRAALLAVMED